MDVPNQWRYACLFLILVLFCTNLFSAYHGKSRELDNNGPVCPYHISYLLPVLSISLCIYIYMTSYSFRVALTVVCLSKDWVYVRITLNMIPCDCRLLYCFFPWLESYTQLHFHPPCAKGAGSLSQKMSTQFSSPKQCFMRHMLPLLNHITQVTGLYLLVPGE